MEKLEHLVTAGMMEGKSGRAEKRKGVGWTNKVVNCRSNGTDRCTISDER